MLLKFALALVALMLIAASLVYGNAASNAAMPHARLACAQENCINAISSCRDAPISGWNDTRYAAAKAPGVELHPCRSDTELALRD